MRPLLLMLLGVLLNNSVFAQNHHCGTDALMKEKIKNDPSLKAKLDINEQLLQNWIAANINKLDQKTRASSKIPVVIHVIHNGEALGKGTNLPDSVLISQLEALNEDYNLKNADSLPTSHPFHQYTASVDLEFCLARKDANGNVSSGITRHYFPTPLQKWATDPWALNNNNFDDLVKPSTAWDYTKYLNLWVCDLGSGLLGYATFPGTATQTDGVVIGYKYFGYLGPQVTAPYDYGRTAVHEIGHYLGLFHIWGDDDNGDGICGASECSLDDNVGDTPNQCERNYGCPTFPKYDNCTSSGAGTMFMNYMDYVDDKCMKMFTKGQKARIWGVINNPFYDRGSLLNASICDWPLETHAQALQSEIQVYPNPSNDFVTLECDFNKVTIVGMLDIAGKQMLAKLNIEKAVNGYTIHVDQLPDGVYFLNVVEAGRKQSFKVVKY